jgi:hypothetical protein
MPACALIHPLTGKPLQEAAPEKAPAPPGAVATAAPVASRPAADRPGKPAPGNSPVPVPEGLSAEDEEAFRVVGATLREILRAGLVNPPTTAPPQTE